MVAGPTAVLPQYDAELALEKVPSESGLCVLARPLGALCGLPIVWVCVQRGLWRPPGGQ